MEVSEGQVRIQQRPFITIADQPLDQCELSTIAKEIQSLCKRVTEQRSTIELLRRELSKVTEGASHGTANQR